MSPLAEMIARLIRKAHKAKVPPPSTQWPERDNELVWMRQKIAYYSSRFPDDAWRLFSPYGGSYLPIYLGTGTSWDDRTQALYRQIKSEYPDLVRLAIANRPKDAICISRVGDVADYDPNIRLR